MSRPLVFLFGLLIFPFATQVNSKTRITMLFGGEYPPYYFENQNKGMFIELLSHFSEANPNFAIDVIPLPRKRINEWLEEGKADTLSLISTEFLDPQEWLQYRATKTIWRSQDVLISHRDKPLQYEEPSSLYGHRIGVIIGNHYKDLEDGFRSKKIYRVDEYSYQNLFAALSTKMLDGVIINQPGYTHMRRLIPDLGHEFFVAEKPLYGFDLVTLIHRDQDAFGTAYQEFLADAERSGLLNNITIRYEHSLNDLNEKQKNW